MRAWKPFLAVLAVAAVASTAAAAARPNPNRGRSLFKSTCKACHVKGGEGKLLTPMTKTQTQWTRVFRTSTAPTMARRAEVKTGKALTAADLADMEAFLVAHAADSDQPETCGQ
jgi:mono/diheme cytochrome c family protein